MNDYYKILGIDKNASEDDVKKAYRRLAHKYHPDKAGGDEKKFKEINEAYQVLSDKIKRSQYDRFGRTSSAGGRSAFGEEGFGGFSAGGFEGFPFGADFGGMEDMGSMGDLFEMFFDGMTGRKRRTYRAGADIEIAVVITLEEAYRGVHKDIGLKTYIPCEICAGAGYFEKEGTAECKTCNGRGEIKEVKKTFFGSFQQVRQCAVCFGTGQIPHRACSACKSTGRVLKEKKISLPIAAGVSDNQLIKMLKAGEAGERRAEAGDLYVRVRVKPHAAFERHGDDLIVRREIGLVDVLLERPITLTHVNGEEIKADVPPHFKLRDRIRVPGKGMPRFNRLGHGDLYIELHVITPKRLSAKAKKLLEELRRELE